MHRANKTQRRKQAPAPALASNLPGVGAPPPTADSIVKATEESLDIFLASEAQRTFQQPWTALDRGSRMDRLRRWVQAYPDVTPAERASLLAAVLQAFELRYLNSKFAVDYDPTTATIITVKGLRERRNAVGLRTFRIEQQTAASRQTQRAKKPTTKTDSNETSE